MKPAFFAAFVLLCLLTACASNKLQFDKMSYYIGNSSLPPQYQEHLTISMDSTKGQVGKKFRETETHSTFEIHISEYKKLYKLTKGFIPDNKDLGEFAVGGSISRIQLFKGDSVVYSLTYQTQHKVGKSVQQFAKKITSLAPKMGLPMPEKE